MGCSVVIPAAGNSGRMGRPKFALPFKGDITFIEELTSRYIGWGSGEIVIVLNPEGLKVFNNLNIDLSDTVKIVINKQPASGRLFSVKTGFASLEDRSCVFVHNVDNPFVSDDVLNALFNSVAGFDFVYPVYNGRGGHPVLLTEKVIEDILSNEYPDRNFRDILKGFTGGKVKVDFEKVTVNINTTDEYKRMH